MRSTSGLVPLPKARLILLVCVGLAVIIGTLAALNRSNLPAVITRVPFADAHGPLMIFGFLCTAISLERAVAFQTGGETKPRWGFGAPVLGVVGTLSVLVLVAGGARLLESLLSASGLFRGYCGRRRWSGWLRSTLRFGSVSSRFRCLFNFLAAVCGAVGALAWAGGTSAASATPWWLMFLVLSIVGGGERLELSHVAFIAAWVEPALITLSCLVLIALAVLRVLPVLGYILLGAVLCALLAVAVYNDTAVRTFKLRGFTGLMGRAMLCAYV